jgi:hypothetical protein
MKSSLQANIRTCGRLSESSEKAVNVSRFFLVILRFKLHRMRSTFSQHRDLVNGYSFLNSRNLVNATELEFLE